MKDDWDAFFSRTDLGRRTVLHTERRLKNAVVTAAMVRDMFRNEVARELELHEACSNLRSFQLQMMKWKP